MTRAELMLRPRTMLRAGRPNGEADPRRLRVGRSFKTNWLFVMDEGATAQCVVYQVCEADPKTGFAGDPVYVGITGDIAARWSTHRAETWWYDLPEVLCVGLDGYRTRADARKHEALLIAEYKPRFNRQAETPSYHHALQNPPEAPIFTAELVPERRPSCPHA